LAIGWISTEHTPPRIIPANIMAVLRITKPNVAEDIPATTASEHDPLNCRGRPRTQGRVSR
jgi:hypothetical protein